MLVRMLINIGGYRNLEPWPLKGETIDVPDHEAADLISQGYAEEARSGATHDDTPADSEPAPADDDAEPPAAVQHEAIRPKGRRPKG